MKKQFQKTISATVTFTFLAYVSFIWFEPSVISAITHDIIVTAEVTEEISISSPADVTLTPSIPGMTGNAGVPASGDATWTVKSSNATGFNMSINATTDPALMLDASYYFYDYTPAAAGSPDYTWTTPLLSSAEFGFTVEPETAADTATKFLDDGGANCEISGGANGVNTCWLDFNGSTDIPIVYRGTATDATGEAEVVRFRAESNAQHLSEGSYTATITVTAVNN